MEVRLRAPIEPAVGMVLTEGELRCVELVEHPPASAGAKCRCGAELEWIEGEEAMKCGGCGLWHWKTKEV